MINMPNCIILHPLEIFCRLVRQGTFSSHFGPAAHARMHHQFTKGPEREEMKTTSDNMKMRRTIL
jgi:hypothetical protein